MSYPYNIKLFEEINTYLNVFYVSKIIFNTLKNISMYNQIFIIKIFEK